MTDFKLPELGENVHGGDVLRVLVKAGDSVKADQPVIELETDKATIEVPSPIGGTVTDVKVKSGQKVEVGQTILTIEEAKETKDTKETEDTKEPAKERAQPVGAAEGGDEAEEQASDRQRDTPGIADTQPAPSERPRVEGPAPSERPRVEGRGPVVRQPEDVIVDAPRPRRGEVVDIGRGTRAAAQGAPAAGSGPAPAAAPSVRRIARELGVDIRQVTGTGPSGRITVEDVQAYVRDALSSGRTAGAAAPARAPAAPPLP